MSLKCQDLQEPQMSDSRWQRTSQWFCIGICVTCFYVVLPRYLCHVPFTRFFFEIRVVSSLCGFVSGSVSRAFYVVLPRDLCHKFFFIFFCVGEVIFQCQNMTHSHKLYTILIQKCHVRVQTKLIQERRLYFCNIYRTWLLRVNTIHGAYFRHCLIVL